MGEIIKISNAMYHVYKKNLGQSKGGTMGILLAIGIILLILWLLGLFAFSWGGLAYILLVVAVICLVIWLIRVAFRRS
jgi:fatty acid desaturase